MECPKCKKTVGENDAVCRNCGIALKEQKKKKNFKNIFSGKKNSPADIPLLETSAPKKGLSIVNGKNEKNIRLAFMIAAFVLIAILIWILIVQISADKGSKKALEASEFIGASVTDCEKDINVHFKDDSAFSIINSAVSFDYIYESEDVVEIDDVKYPEWSISLLEDSSENIKSVTYTDYKLLEDDSRGEKLDKRINLDRFDKGAKFRTVSDDIELEPFKIIYTDKSVSYQYKYYYIDSNSDAQRVLLTVAADKEGGYLYYTSIDIYPQYM